MRAAVLTAFEATTTAPASLCVGVVPLQQSSDPGQAAKWEVGAWAEGGTVSAASIQLTSTAGTGTPVFSFGCGSGNGTSACSLGTVDSSSAQRLFEAQVTVPASATSIPAVSLTVTGSATSLSADPAAAASIVMLAAGSPAQGSSSAPSPAGLAAFPTPSASSGGSASTLFPAVAPSSQQGEGATPVANVSALPGGSGLGSEVAEGAGLAAVAVAMFLAITRLSFRRPAPRHAANSGGTTRPPTSLVTPAESEKSYQAERPDQLW